MQTRIVSTALSAGLAIGMLSGCANDAPPPAEPRGTDAPPPRDSKRPATAASQDFTGTLEGGVMAIGGETTGWRLIGEGESGQMDVDISRVADDARRLRGQRVTITGTVITRDYVERGPMPVLVAERITPAPR
jgi:hypothetical protein